MTKVFHDVSRAGDGVAEVTTHFIAERLADESAAANPFVRLRMMRALPPDSCRVHPRLLYLFRPTGRRLVCR